MDKPELDLRKFCALKGIQIIRERDVQYGQQFTLKALSDVVHITLFMNKVLVQGPSSYLKEVMSAWGDTSAPLVGSLKADLPSGWREWNGEANWIRDFHVNNGIPKEEDLNHRYMINREVLFHDYMLRNGPHSGITFDRLEYLLRSWFNRNCFMNFNVNLLIENLKSDVLEGGYWDLSLDNIDFPIAADLISNHFAGQCYNKYVCNSKGCFCPQTETDHIDCVVDIVDALYPYFSNKVLSYTKGNLLKLLKYDYSLKWTNITPSTPIEEKMSNGLIDSGILTVPQYQAWDEKHRYNIDFVIKTPQGLNIAVECDGLQFHAKASRYIQDRKRDRYLQDKGFYVMRFSSVEIYNEMDNVLREIDETYWKIQKQKLDIRTPFRISYFGCNENE